MAVGWLLAQQAAQAVKPQPAAHGVEGIAGRVAGAALHLRVLVGDQVAAGQLARPQAVVEGQR